MSHNDLRIYDSEKWKKLKVDEKTTTQCILRSVRGTVRHILLHRNSTSYVVRSECNLRRILGRYKMYGNRASNTIRKLFRGEHGWQFSHFFGAENERV